MKAFVAAFVVVLTSLLLQHFAMADVLTLSTAQDEFDATLPNQGFWSGSSSFNNNNTNTAYFAGQSSGIELRDFFTFDLSSVTGQIVSATLNVNGAVYDGGGSGETLNLYDVATNATTLNDNTGFSAAIWNDLGSGNSYGSYLVMPYAKDAPLSFALDAQAVTDLNAGIGTYFSIGGAVVNTDNGGLFSPDGTPLPVTLTITTAASDSSATTTPLPSPAYAGLGLLGGLGCWMLARRRKAVAE